MMVWAVSLLTKELSPHGLTTGIARRYSEFDSVADLSAFTTEPVALPPPLLHGASPKTISERTSYYQIRLAFHSLPQLIRRF